MVRTPDAHVEPRAVVVEAADAVPAVPAVHHRPVMPTLTPRLTQPRICIFIFISISVSIPSRFVGPTVMGERAACMAHARALATHHFRAALATSDHPQSTRVLMNMI